MLKNLSRILRDRGISLKEYGGIIGASEKTVHNKINETTDFSLPEIMKTKTLFREYDLYYIFESDRPERYLA